MIFEPSIIFIAGLFLLTVVYYVLSVFYCSKSANNSNAFVADYWKKKGFRYEVMAGIMQLAAIIFGLYASFLPCY